MLLGASTQDPLLPIPTTPDGGGITVEIDWEKNGFGPAAEELPYSDVYTDAYGTVQPAGHLADVTRLVRPNAQAVNCEYGRDQSTAMSPTVAGRGGFVLDNRSRMFSPRNTDSLLYGKMKPARPVRITRQIGSDVYSLFTGHTDDTPINPDLDAQTVSLSLLDYLADFRGRTITTPLYRDLRTGEAIAAVLDACDWPANLRDLEAGATVIPFWWEENGDAFEALEKILRSEGPPALLTQAPDGSIVFRDRHHRLLSDRSVTSQQTWRASGAVQPVMNTPFTYDEAWRNIINTGTINVDVRSIADEQAVWSADAPITLAAGEQKVLNVVASEPFMDAVPPEMGTDFTWTGGTINVALSRDSGQSLQIILSGAAGVIRDLQLRAKPIPVGYTIQVTAADQQSIADYGARSFPNDLPWCTPADAQAVLDTAVALRSDPVPILQVQFVVGRNVTKAQMLLTRDLSDRVTIIEPTTGLADDFFIESIQHSLTSLYDHTISFGVEAVPVVTDNLFRFDTLGAGFDAGVFGSGAVGGSLFQFDVSSFNADGFAA